MKRPAALLTGVVLLLLVWLVLLPNVFVLADSLRGAGGWSLEHYRRFLGSGAERDALWASLWISALSVVLSAMVGVPLAFLFARRDFPGRRVLGALAAMPVLLPPLVGTISFMFLYGESGLLTRGVQALLGLEAAPWRLTGPVAVLLVHGYTMYVYFYLFTTAGLARLDAGYAEASAALGAGRWTTLRRVTLPMLGAALGGAALLVFMTSMGSFSAPYVFGGGFRVLTTQLYSSKLNNEVGLVAVEATVLALASLLFLVIQQRWESSREYTGASKGLGAAPPRVRAGWGTTALAAAFVGFLLLPHATVLLVSFVPEGTWTTQTLPPVYSSESYQRLFAERERLRPVINSLGWPPWPRWPISCSRWRPPGCWPAVRGAAGRWRPRWWRSPGRCRGPCWRWRWRPCSASAIRSPGAGCWWAPGSSFRWPTSSATSRW
jgi:iron(III) transport system permease protein